MKGFLQGQHPIHGLSVIEAAELIGAVPADIPGLWFAVGYPELTTGQLLDIANRTAMAAQGGEAR